MIHVHTGCASQCVRIKEKFIDNNLFTLTTFQVREVLVMEHSRSKEGVISGYNLARKRIGPMRHCSLDSPIPRNHYHTTYRGNLFLWHLAKAGFGQWKCYTQPGLIKQKYCISKRNGGPNCQKSFKPN